MPAYDVSSAVGLWSNVASIWLLVVIFRQEDYGEPVVPAAKVLRVAADVTVFAWGFWVAFQVVRLLATPYTYAVLRGYALQLGRTPPAFFDLVVDAGCTLLSQSSMFALPYIVRRSIQADTPCGVNSREVKW